MIQYKGITNLLYIKEIKARKEREEYGNIAHYDKEVKEKGRKG
jgi:hypothetical protein